MLNFWWCSCCSSSGRPFLCPAKPERRGIALPRLLSRTHVISSDTAWECFVWWASCEDGDGMDIKPSKKACYLFPMKPEKPCWINFQDLLNPPLTQTSANHHPSMICVFQDDCFDDRPGVIFHDDVSTEALEKRDWRCFLLKCPLID